MALSEERYGKMHDHLWTIVPTLPSDYEPYGQARREGNDCSCGCKHFRPLEEVPYDWGVCSNPKSPRCGLLTFEHQNGLTCFEYDEEDECDRTGGHIWEFMTEIHLDGTRERILDCIHCHDATVRKPKVTSGTRVRLRGSPSGVTLRSPNAVFLSEEDEDHWLLRLEEPAIYHRIDGKDEDIFEIRESWDNLEVIDGDV